MFKYHIISRIAVINGASTGIDTGDVCLSCVLWKNGWLDVGAMWGGRWAMTSIPTLTPLHCVKVTTRPMIDQWRNLIHKLRLRNCCWYAVPHVICLCHVYAYSHTRCSSIQHTFFISHKMFSGPRCSCTPGTHLMWPWYAISTPGLLQHLHIDMESLWIGHQTQIWIYVAKSNWLYSMWFTQQKT